MLHGKPMPKQFASFNAFVSRQTLPYSSCDGLCTDQNDTAAMFILSGDIAVVCSKHFQTSHRKYMRSIGCRANASKRSDDCFAIAQANASSLLSHLHSATQPLSCLTRHLRSNVICTVMSVKAPDGMPHIKCRVTRHLVSCPISQ